MNRSRTSNCIHDAWKLRQKTVTNELHGTALMLGDFGVDQFCAMGLPCRMSACFIQVHEAAIGHYICCEDGGQSSAHNGIAHVTTSLCVLPRSRVAQIQPILIILQWLMNVLS
ncbi:hypothetical protein BB934_35355 (plasmid) [Microvirga ossetica]|uniref:Uncharacterized protein n=1 Tax=Microvirga ossetica TaxID=1882682 RepID=A0A1B2EU98_9HYPH|nr:hypothetical protein BB934_35355 [Microvirga ossetica]